MSAAVSAYANRAAADCSGSKHCACSVNTVHADNNIDTQQELALLSFSHHWPGWWPEFIDIKATSRQRTNSRLQHVKLSFSVLIKAASWMKNSLNQQNTMFNKAAVASTNAAYVKFSACDLDTLSFYIKPVSRNNVSTNVATAPDMRHYLSADCE